MQGDGNLVLTEGTSSCNVVWNTASNPLANPSFVVQYDADIMIYGSSGSFRVAWPSSTGYTHPYRLQL